MELVWTLDIDDKNYLPSCHNCKPILWKDKLIYAFHTVNKTKIDKDNLYGIKIVLLEINIHNKEINKREILLSKNQNERILKTKYWHFINDSNNLILLTGLKLNLKKSKITISEDYVDEVMPIIKSHYNYTDKYITYNQRSKLECFDENSKNLLWTQNIKRYLYTNITIKSNLIFFGTAGKGGAFYTINSDTGEIIVEFYNGDASEYTWSSENIIIKDKKGNLVKLNPKTGEIINTLNLKEKIHFDCPILVDDNKIFTRVYNPCQKTPKIIYVEDI